MYISESGARLLCAVSRNQPLLKKRVYRDPTLCSSSILFDTTKTMPIISDCERHTDRLKNMNTTDYIFRNNCVFTEQRILSGIEKYNSFVINIHWDMNVVVLC
jgi:hypothetical protein